MKRILHAFIAFGLSVVPLHAENAPVVVELFTSQGCSSCPPADEMMKVLADREDVIALSLHVDYWDYIGWKDEFADPRHAKRQRAYATEAGRRSIYTPEMIVNGVSDIVGAKPMDLAMAIEKHKSQPKRVELQVFRQGGEIAISARVVSDPIGPATVQVLRYRPARQSNITRGENAGRSIEYVNVAQDWQIVQNWDGAGPLTSSVSLPDDLPIVVLVQAENHGPIFAAARVR